MKKKVAIMSMQRIINYGSFLQAYGLKKIIENITDTHVEFVDYVLGENIINKRTSKIKYFLSKIKRDKTIRYYLKKNQYYRKEKKALIVELKKIGIDRSNYNKNIDTLIIGSDEVFNCLQPYPVGYSRNLFGKGYEKCNVISYAASFGHTSFEDLEKYGISNEIGSMLSKFKSISVRDENSYLTVKKLIGIEAERHLDPVLVYDFEKEMGEFTMNEKDYIVLYVYTGRLSEREEDYIRKFAKRINKKILSIGNYSEIANKNIICNPLYVFSYFINADYIITDTFHGTVISIKTNSKFCTIIRESNRNKLGALLQQLGRVDRVVERLKDIDRLYIKTIDYSETNKIIHEEKEKTIQYLKDNI